MKSSHSATPVLLLALTGFAAAGVVAAAAGLFAGALAVFPGVVSVLLQASSRTALNTQHATRMILVIKGLLKFRMELTRNERGNKDDRARA